MKPPALPRLTDDAPEDTQVQRRTSSELTDLKSAASPGGRSPGDLDDGTEDHCLPPLATEDFEEKTPTIEMPRRLGER